MKILFVSDLYRIDEQDKTIPKIFEDFALLLKKEENEILVVRPNFLINTIIRKHKIYKSKIYKKNNIEIINRNFILPFIFENKNFINELKNKNLDLIISHMPSGHIWANLINKALKLPHIAIIHQSDFEVLNNFKYSFYFKNRLKKALSKANLKGARNIFLKDKLKADFILPSFVDKKTILENKKINSKKLKIITLSKLIKRKNIDLVIKALKEINFDFEYEIYGNGKEEKYLKNLIKKFSLEEKIKIYPFIEHEKIYEKLDKNDIFILPSIKESFGLCYLEALSRGLITIGTKNTGIDGIIKDNENGFLINPTKKEIIKILNKINLLTLQEREKIANNSLMLIKQYQKENIAYKYFEIIKKLV